MSSAFADTPEGSAIILCEDRAAAGVSELAQLAVSGLKPGMAKLLVGAVGLRLALDLAGLA